MADPEQNNEQKSVNNLTKYSAIAFQMLAIIGVFTYIGYQIDEHRKSSQPLITALFSLAGVILALFQVIRQVNKNK